MLTPSCRSLLPALAVSLALHVVLLSSALEPFPTRLALPATTLKAVLRAAAPAPGASPAGLANAAAKPSLAGRRESAEPRPVAPLVNRSAAEPLRPALPESGPSLAAGAAAQTAAAPASGAVPSPGPVSGAAASAAAGAAREGVSADDLRQYRLSLASAARRFRRYPVLARQRGWEGTVEVALTVSSRTPVPDVILVRSSGRRILDEQAVDMLTQAAGVTALPDGLRARDFRVLLPVQFSLADDQ